MWMRMLMIVFLVMLLSGCATTNTRTTEDIQVLELQNRIDYLEKELAKKNQEISDLTNELEKAQDAALSVSEEKSEGAATGTARLSIKEVQRALKNAAFYNGPIDGKKGSKTRRAIKAFQKANGLKADGLVGQKTREKLRKYLTH